MAAANREANVRRDMPDDHERSSQAWRVSVVHVATPVPRKSLSFVQIPAVYANALATTGQSA